MDHVLFALAVLVPAFLFAKVEIHIEGGSGWAEKLPTWRIQNRWTDLLYGGRPLTGYHLWVQLFVLAMTHLVFALGLAWTPRAEALVLAFMILFWIVEDFLWFVVNPSFGLRRFRSSEIWWHRRAWWLVAPREYFIMGAVAAALYAWARAWIG
jgi:hypothetical protein